jgi:hypothetical protein
MSVGERSAFFGFFGHGGFRSARVFEILCDP